MAIVVLVTALIAPSLLNVAEHGVGDDMHAVSSAKASLKPKPIATLSRAEARRQPEPANAVNANDA